MANLLASPSFENDSFASNWSMVPSQETLTRSQLLTPVHGSYHGLITTNSAGTGKNLDSSAVNIAPNTAYSFGIFVRWVTGATPREARLDVRWNNGTTTTTSTGTATLTNTGSWTQLTRLNVISPADVVTVQLRCVLLAPAAGGEQMAVDMAQLNPGPTLEPYTNKWRFSKVVILG